MHVLRDYALIADGERGILVGPRGEHAWLCAPVWDSAAVFGALIGGGGLYAVTPVGDPFVWGGYYDEATLIWRNRWATDTGIVECCDALARPADPHTVVVLRRIETVDGPARVRAVLDPRADFGRHRLTRLRCRDGVWAGRCGSLYVRWSGAPDAAPCEDGGLEAVFEVPEGEHHAWIRDQCYAGQAVAAVGRHTLMNRAVDFVADRLAEDGAKLRPAYTVRGGSAISRSARARARSCCAASPPAWPCTSRVTRRGRTAGSSVPVPAAARPACSPRSTTSSSASCAGTFRRPLCTPCCSRRRRGRPARRPR